MDKRTLHYQADRIEMVLLNHSAPSRVTGGRVTPSTIQFHLAPGPKTKVGQVEKLSEEIALTLGVSSARVTRTRGKLAIEVPRPNARAVTLTAVYEKLEREAALTPALTKPGTALLGLDSDGVPLLVRLASPDIAHMLIAGTTGSGKTELTKSIVASLMLGQKVRDIQIILLDPKGSAFKSFAGLAYLLTDPVTLVPQIVERVRWLVGEMERREVQGNMRPRLVLVIDELADIMMTGGKVFQADITRLVQRGRSAGISVIACTQKPTANAVGSLVKANFPVRLVGRVTSADEARLASGLPGSGAERLAGRGDFILIAGGEQVHFQAAFIPGADWPNLRERIANGAPPSPGNDSGPAGLLARLRRTN